MTLQRDLIKENLPKKGFVEFGGDHTFYHLVVEGKKRLFSRRLVEEQNIRYLETILCTRWLSNVS